MLPVLGAGAARSADHAVERGVGGKGDAGERGERQLQRPEKRDETRFLSRGEFRLQHEIEELHGVFQREQAVVVEIGRRVFDAVQGGRS